MNSSDRRGENAPPANSRRNASETFGSWSGTASEQFLEDMERWASDPETRVRVKELSALRASFAGAASGIHASQLGWPEFPGFTLLDKLGQGSFGAVYRARDDELRREVALKVLLPHAMIDKEARESFLNEARVLARVRHQNVLTIHSIETSGERIGLVMEFIDGETLDAGVERSGSLGAEEAIQIGIQTCRALAAVHASGLVHRDVKTANILRERGGRIVLSDFGLGIFIDTAERTRLAGTPLFMAPEQIEGAKPDGRSDLYALGVVLYWLVAQSYPFSTAVRVDELFAAKRSGQVAPLRDKRPDLPEEFVEVVQRALRTDPDERFQSAGEMESALIDCLKSGSGTRSTAVHVDANAASPGRVEAPRSASQSLRAGRKRRHAVLWTGVAALILAAILVALRLPVVFGFSVEEASLWAVGQFGERRRVEESELPRLEEPFYLEFRADTELFVYLLSEDECSFPIPQARSKNPLAPGQSHRLPGRKVNGTFEALQVSDGTSDTLFLVASRTPIASLEPESLSDEEAPPPEDLRTIEHLEVNVNWSGQEQAAVDLYRSIQQSSRWALWRKGWWVKRFDVANP